MVNDTVSMYKKYWALECNIHGKSSYRKNSGKTEGFTYMFCELRWLRYKPFRSDVLSQSTEK